VDLERAVIWSYAGARAFFGALSTVEPGRLAFSCRRLGVRKAIRAWHGPEMRLFPTREEAALSLVRPSPRPDAGREVLLHGPGTGRTFAP
jgi:hypothetical protein